MRFDYSFVPRLANGLPRDEVQQLRQSVVLGSHADAILKEALLDRDYERSAVPEAVRAIGGDFIINSFADEHFRNSNLLLRSEFLILSYSGGRPLDGSDAARLIERTRARIQQIQCQAVIYRLCDYNPEELAFLPDRPFHSRGAQRLLDDHNLLAYDMDMIDALLDIGIPVDVLVPFVQLPEQLAVIGDAVRRRFGCKRAAPRRLGMMIEVPANLYEVSAFAEAAFFVFGPGDLLRFFYGGIERNDVRFEHISANILWPPILEALRAIERMSGRTVFFAKSLTELTKALNYAQFPNTEIRRLYMPSQIAPIAAAGIALPSAITSQH